MTVHVGISEAPASADAIHHPLEPLTAAEIEEAVAILRASGRLGEQVRFASISLREPAKETVLSFQPGDPVTREAFIILLDNATNAVHEAVVSLSLGAVTAWRHVPGVQ